jgi:hypothetical protein
MGKPTEVENVSIKRLENLADILESGTATNRDRDEALGTVMRMWAAERRFGLLSMEEFEDHKKSKDDHDFDTLFKYHIANCPNKRVEWNAAKTWSIIFVALTASGTITGIVYMIFVR